MTQDDFRRIALSLPGAIESSHMGTVDFRAGRIFATLGYPDAGFGMVKLTPERQEMLVLVDPAIFEPVKGGWGAKGATLLCLTTCGEATATGALTSAWQGVASKTLLKAFDAANGAS
ncbi:MmcQ/YjbR family DNA-binding protein [Caulobacter sp. DWR1-3-2b1]|uniref:MmcQ/YjbR family DNA-binding protein n=1 Tax=Caulobacter sp. DWR1-3-2b1 TaxID=2804670 RepID=UPI003CF5D25C